MSELHQPTLDHAEFDAICDGLEDWETLPEPTTAPDAQAAWHAAQDAHASETAQDTPLDEQILAGLITPW